RYDLRAIDLDIENADLADAASIERRALAIAAVQEERAAAEEQLDVWITLPVTTGGLTADGIELVTKTLEGGVVLTGVNAMTMNFGSAESPTRDMLAATKSALEAASAQLVDIYRGQGVTLDESQRWAMLGATPMIGQNDIVGEVFTLDDAKGLADFAMTKGLGRVSIWSLNRDAQCSPSFADVMVLSNTCSSVEQDPLAFAGVFTVLVGRTSSLPQGNSVTVTDPPNIIDDPAASPYPIWRPDAQYPDGF
ncbi:MAG: chitinase, partial [Actinomycetota bacterium]|nr:chitinase [Actinomycetota bacterium]